MQALSNLLESLSHSREAADQQALIRDYMCRVPDPDRGWGIAILTGALRLRALTQPVLRRLAETRLDPDLLNLARETAGDWTETLSLIWPEGSSGPGEADPPSLEAIVTAVTTSSKSGLPTLMQARLPGWLDNLDAPGRYHLLKLLTGGQTSPVSLGQVRRALADHGGHSLAEVEELWFGLTPPYGDLLAWMDGAAPRPQVDTGLLFRALPHARDGEADQVAALDPAEYRATLQPDGLRALLAARDGRARLYSDAAEEIGAAFPEILSGRGFTAVLDGILVGRVDGRFTSAAPLQARLGKSKLSEADRTACTPVFLATDLLFLGERDLRPEPFEVRWQILAGFVTDLNHSSIDLIKLEKIQETTGFDDPAVASLLLKRLKGPYDAAEAETHWHLVKRPARTLRCLLMHVRRKSGWGASEIVEIAVGIRREDQTEGVEILPVAKLAFDGPAADLIRIADWVRDHPTEKFGPVQSVAPGLVLDIAYDAIDPAPRRKAKLALRAPRLIAVQPDLDMEATATLVELSP